MGRPDPHIRDAMLAHLRKNYPGTCRHWFDDIEPVDIAGGTLKLLVREPVQLKYLQRACMEPFKEAAQAATGHLLAIRFIGEAELGDDGRPVKEAPRKVTIAPATPVLSTLRPAISNDEEMLLSPDYTFDSFVVGPNNRLAHAAAQAVSQKPGRAYNPFFIHGGVGLGKTHLLQAICQTAMRCRTIEGGPSLRIMYISCNAFMTQFLDSVQDGTMSQFRDRFRNLDLLVVDDIHDLSKRDRTQEEFFHTFNVLHQAGKQIVLSSDAAPVEIPALEERLVSRFNSGLVARIDKPCFETRVEIVKSKAALRTLPMPDDVASFIASHIDSNIRELEGAVIKLQGLSLIDSHPIDLSLAKQALGDFSTPSSAPTPSIQTILEAVSGFYDVRLADLLSKRRNKSIARPRQIGMWLARKHTRYSLEEIGSYFGGRDHTTVMHAIRAVDQRCGNDPTTEREVTTIEQKISSNDGMDFAAIPNRMS